MIAVQGHAVMTAIGVVSASFTNTECHMPRTEVLLATWLGLSPLVLLAIRLPCCAWRCWCCLLLVCLAGPGAAGAACYLGFSWGRWCCLLLGFSAEPAAPLLQFTCCLLLGCRAGPGAAGAACYLSALLVLRCCCCVVDAVCHSAALLDLVL